jgi:2'-5' RNA ligase
VQWQRGWRWPAGARPTPPERLHLTLHFLGQVEAVRLPALASGLRLPPFEPFEITLGLPECWPGGLAVLCPHKLPDSLVRLHRELGVALERLGTPIEPQPFRPHVTLARRAGGALAPPAAGALRWPVEGYALVQSERGYRTLASYPGTVSL